MAENTDGTQEASQETNAVDTPQYSDSEQRALAQGWVPEDQFTGSGKWRSAEEFLDRGELFSKIDEQHRRIRAQEQTTQELKKHLERVRKNEYDRALTTLRAEKKVAARAGDTEALVEIDEQIEDLKEKERTETVVEVQPINSQPDPVFVVWQNKNSWYNTDKAMKVFADAIGQELIVKGLRGAELLNEVERQTKKEFADRFTNPNRAKASSVDSGRRAGSASKDNFQLSEDEIRVMNKFVKAGHMTKEEYIADIKADREKNGA